MVKKGICLIFLLFGSLIIFSQEQQKEEKTEEGMKGTHRVTIGLGHTHLAEGKNVDGEKVWINAPSWSLNYDYWIANKWAIGLQTEMVLEKFIVEKSDGEDLERNKPIALILVGLYKPGKHFAFIAGGGIEFEEEENLSVTRLGIEYGVDLPKGWEAGVAAVWDIKWNGYNSWGLEFAFSKKFVRRK
jgi:hypothetical protein